MNHLDRMFIASIWLLSMMSLISILTECGSIPLLPILFGGLLLGVAWIAMIEFWRYATGEEVPG